MTSRNQRICDIFERILETRINEGHTYRAKAYQKVIPILRGYHKDIESGDEAKQIPGIGKSIAAKIDEIIETGTVSELNNYSTFNDKQSVLKLFQSIERVGIKTAEKWYNSGYRQLSDIPQSECTTAQWIGIQLHKDLIQRIPRKEIKQLEIYLHQQLDPKNIQFQICGSYRRGKAESGDIDILLIARNDIDVLAEILKLPLFTHTLAYGPKKFMGVCKIDQVYRRIDVELVQPQEYPYAVIYFTGPARFNVMMRDHASKYNLRLNEKTLTNQQGQSYIANDEQHVFLMLGLQYLLPEQRELYA